MITAAHGNNAVLGNEFFHQRPCLLRQTFCIGNDNFDITAEHTAGRVDVSLSQNHGIAHRLTTGHGTWRRKRSEAPDLDGAIGSECRAAERRQTEEACDEANGGRQFTHFFHSYSPHILSI